jgi:hypothetical protein
MWIQMQNAIGLFFEQGNSTFSLLAEQIESTEVEGYVEASFGLRYA